MQTMASRLLLTLLALLASLAAQLSTAQARIRADGVSEVVAFIQSDRAAVVRPAARIPDTDYRKSERSCSVVMLDRDVDCAPTVMLGADRARE